MLGLYSRKIIYLWSAVTFIWAFIFLFVIAFHQELGFIKEETVTSIEYYDKEIKGHPPHHDPYVISSPIELTEVQYVNRIQFFLSATPFTKLSWLFTPPLSLIFLVYLIDKIFRLIKNSPPPFFKFKKDKLQEYQDEDSDQDAKVDSDKVSPTTIASPLSSQTPKKINYGEDRDILIPEKIISFKIYTEKKINEGEDGIPLISSCGEGKLVGAVFDGLGGSGSSKITSSGGVTKTQAYFASRIVRDFFSGACVNHAIDTFFVKNVLETQLSQYMKTAANDFTFPQTQIITKRASQLPTTLAGFYLGFANSDAMKATIFWAGDSRCYLLDEANGLFPLTKDDLLHEADEFENLKTDSPLSNYIDATGNFTINLKKFKLSKTNILIAATDGCFGYFQTPMHFELMMLKTLSASKSMSHWQSNIEEQIVKVAQDDATLAMVATGWESFDEIKRAFSNRLEETYAKFIKDVDAENEKIISLKKELEDRQTHFDKIKLNAWKKYFSSRK